MAIHRKALQTLFCQSYTNATSVGKHMRNYIETRFFHNISLNSRQISPGHCSVSRIQSRYWRDNHDSFKNQTFRFLTASAGAFLLLANRQLMCEENSDEEEVIEVENR